MPDRATVFQTVQLGVEVTPGVPVAATRKLVSVGFDPDPQFQTDAFTAMGNKFESLVTLGREWGEAAITGRPTFDEIHYLFASLLTNVAPQTPGTPGGALARFWDYTAATSQADTPVTYTLEQGSTFRGQRFAHAIIRELGIEFTRAGISLSGNALMTAMEEPFTLSGGATSLPLVPILSRTVDIYLDATSAGLGTTKLLRCTRFEWRMANRFGGIWPLNSAKPSFDGVVETKPDLTGTLRVEADAQGMALKDNIRNGSTVFIRAVAQGAFIDALGTVAITSSTNVTPPVFTTATHSLAVDDVVVIAGHSISSYNGTWRVNTVPLTTTVTFKDPITGTLMQANGAGTAGTLAKQVNPYQLRIDTAYQVQNSGGYQDDDGLYAIEWNLRGVHDGTYGKSHVVRVQNKQTAL